MGSYNLIMIGCSLGGLKALSIVLPRLSHGCSSPTVIVQHHYCDHQTSGMLSSILQRASNLTIEEPEDRTPISPDYEYMAPADYHLLIEEGRMVLSTEPPVAHARPSIDVAFETAARCYGPSLVEVILTGKATDGASRICEVERRGGLVIVQDPVTAKQTSMPQAAISATSAPTVLPLKSIAPFLCSLTAGGGSRDESRVTG
jgi:two-component system chemotaxis response regulator CheB